MNREDQKEILGESQKTRRTREKLQRYLDRIEREVSPQALQKKSQEIHHWISRHSSDRVVLKSKDISLFDENRNSAKASGSVASLASRLEKEGLQGS